MNQNSDRLLSSKSLTIIITLLKILKIKKDKKDIKLGDLIYVSGEYEEP